MDEDMRLDCMKYKEIITQEVGIINGRDAIYLDEFKQVFNDIYDFIFTGSFNPKLIEFKTDKDEVPYTIKFKEVIYCQCCELDTYENEVKMASSFDLVINSDLLQKLKNGRKSSNVTEDHKHYMFQTYDYVYDIIATDYILEI